MSLWRAVAAIIIVHCVAAPVVADAQRLERLAIASRNAEARHVPPVLAGSRFHAGDSPRNAPPTGRRRAAQFLVGVAAASTLGMVAWSVVDDPEGSDRRVKGDAGYTPDANTALAVGSFAGAVAGTWVVGRGDGSSGSLTSSALGAAVPTVLLLLGRHQPYLPILSLLLGFPSQALGGTVGYSLSRRE